MVPGRERLEATIVSARTAATIGGLRSPVVPPLRLGVPSYEIILLGRFVVRVDGQPVPAGAWRHRRAAELVKILALADAHRLHSEQVVITPDPQQPEAITAAADPRIVWFNFRALHYAIESVTAEPAAILAEQARFLFREIQTHIPRIRHVEDHVTFTHDEIASRKDGPQPDQRIGEVIESTLTAGTRDTGQQYQVFVLSGPDDPDTVKLSEPVINDTLSAAGKPWAWTLGQRYTSLAKLTVPGLKVTSDLAS